MAENESLHQAKNAKKDEFYTQITDIEREIAHYKPHFFGKVVYCNCDDPYESHFFKYFALNFKELGLRKLIATSYADSIIAGTQLDLFGNNSSENITRKTPYRAIMTGLLDINGDTAENHEDIEIILKKVPNAVQKLQGNGDFRSKECIELLKEADIVVTNPPFSLFREYVAQLIEYKKKFLIIGNKNAITYKEIFPLIKDNKIWIGYTPMTYHMNFIVPDSYIEEIREAGKEYSLEKKNGVWLGRSQAIWFTNLDHNKRHNPMELPIKYDPKKFPKYDNYDAINVDVTKDIPYDYDGVMGVPLTFLDKYCPEQFEMLGIMNTGEENPGIRYPNTPHGRPVVNGKEKYIRILIRHKR